MECSRSLTSVLGNKHHPGEARSLAAPPFFSVHSGISCQPIEQTSLEPGTSPMLQAPVSRRSLAERYTAEFARSRQLHERARTIFPNGVTHDLRHLEPFPVYVADAEGGHKRTV